MKFRPDDIARALVEESMAGGGGKVETLVDAALTVLTREASPSAIRSFPQLVARALRRCGVVDARLRVPVKSIAPDIRGIEQSLRGVRGASITVDVLPDETISGGAVLEVGDERFDASIPGRLQLLRDTLTV